MATDKDPRTYVRIHDGMPDHPKVDGLSDAAFRLLVTMWCWCSRHLTDGLIPSATWQKRGKQKVRDELVEAGLVDLREDGTVCMHDYTDHQRTAEEVREARKVRSDSGSYGNHVKWHVKRGVSDPDCDHCPDRKRIAQPSQTDRKRDPESIANASQIIAETETETEVLTNVSTLAPRGAAKIPRASNRGTRIPDPFTVDEAMKDWAVERNMQPQWVLRQTERFVNYWTAIPGVKGVKNDWRATWRNWLLKAQDDAPTAAPVSRNGYAKDDVRARFQ